MSPLRSYGTKRPGRRYPGMVVVPRTYNQEIDDDNPISHYKLGEAAGATVAADRKSVQNGTIYGTPVLGANGLLPFNNVDNAILFDGVDDRVGVTHNAAHSFTGAFSVEAWFSLASLPAAGSHRTIITKGLNYNLRIDPAGLMELRIEKAAVGYFARSTGFTFALNTIYHVVATYDGTKPYLYINGVLVGDSDTPPAGDLTTVTTALTIASSASPSRFWHGTLDEVAIYGTALTAQRALAHYTRGTTSGSSGGGGQPPPGAGGIDTGVTPTKFASPTGSNSTGTGTETNPWQTPQYLAQQLSAGQVGGLLNGTYQYEDSSGRTLNLGSSFSGTSGSVKTIRNAIGHRPVIRGDALFNADYWTVWGLKFETGISPGATNIPFAIARSRTTSFVTFEWCEIDGRNSSGVNQHLQGVFGGAEGSGYFANDITFRRCRIHHVGTPDVNDKADHGIYWSYGYRLLVELCKIHDVPTNPNHIQSGLQLYPNCRDATIRRNIIDRCQTGMNIGVQDSGDQSSGNLVERNIISNTYSYNGDSGSALWIYQGSGSSIGPNRAIDNHTWQVGKNITAGENLTVEGTTIGDPLYTDAAGSVYVPLGAGSPAAGKGPDW